MPLDTSASVADLIRLLYWAAIAGISFLVVAMIKIWFWLMMVKNSIVRELKK